MLPFVAGAARASTKISCLRLPRFAGVHIVCAKEERCCRHGMPSFLLLPMHEVLQLQETYNVSCFLMPPCLSCDT